MNWCATLLFLFVLAQVPTPTPAPAPGPTLSPMHEMIVRGQLLVIANGYLVFTTGDAVRLSADAQIAPSLHLGQTIRVHLDPQTHRARKVEALTAPPPASDVDVNEMPRDYVAVSPGSARSIQNEGGKNAALLVTVRIDVTVPADTPPTDDIYLSTDRSAFSAAELRMNRVDAYHWTVTLPAIAGSTLQYEFTRGSYTSVERDASGGVFAPRKLEIEPGIATKDTVARWADIS
ncbi:MAG TPA: hypothetical protein VME66_16165 [Candidatus Acidoferrales bacterium]|nr:hypothetical protein [Candidatus Acidoferrales bacterium]